MSKLSFRARALDASKPMPVYKSEEIPDLPDFAAINRAVPQMPTGMEKEEESEHHLQRALSAQQVYGTAEALVIPVPEISEIVKDRYMKLYGVKGDFKPPKQYVHVQAFGMDQEIPDYDMDSEDETWLTKQAKKMDVTPRKFENMMDRLEKGSGQMVVTLQEAKALLKEDDELIMAVYDYWLNKRLRTQHRLIPQVKTEKRDGSTTNDPYVAFRRRTEKMQTRKNRKNDEVSYEKMLKLRRDLNRALTILEMMKRREKSKKEMLQLTIEVYEKRYQMQDWSATMLAEALAQRHKLPALMPVQYDIKSWGGRVREEGGIRKKREYKKRKHKQTQQQHANHSHQQATVQLPQYSHGDVLHPDAYTSDDDQLSPPVSPPDNEAEDDPDGVYAFRRKANCHYHTPISDGLGNWPWCGREEGGFGESRYRYCLTSIPTPKMRCVGYARRRMGRGGRVILDRGYSDWDDYLSQLDLTSTAPVQSRLQRLISHIKENRIPHFRPRLPTEEGGGGRDGEGGCGSPTVSTEFNAESFQNHQEQLLAMQRQQLELLMKADTDIDGSFDLDHSFSSQPTSRFTLDSASARFAASAVCTSAQDLIQNIATSNSGPGVSVAPSGASSTSAPSITTSSHPGPTTSLTNGPLDTKASGLSTSPAATVLQLNYPIVSAVGAAVTTTPSLTTPVSLVTGATSTAVPPVITARPMTQAQPSTIFKLAATPNNIHDTLPKESRENVNSLVTDQVVAMEVT